MSILIKYVSGPPIILRSARRLEARIKLLGPPIIKRIVDGFQLTWMYSLKKGVNKSEPKITTYDLRIENDREIMELEIFND